jgi:hypothetical protein
VAFARFDRLDQFQALALEKFDESHEFRIFATEKLAKLNQRPAAIEKSQRVDHDMIPVRSDGHSP